MNNILKHYKLTDLLQFITGDTSVISFYVAHGIQYLALDTQKYN